MKTTLCSKAKKVIINTYWPVVITDESINPTRRKKVVPAFEGKNFVYILELAKSQIDALLDVNVGFRGADEICFR